jgi:hypothetical protein
MFSLLGAHIESIILQFVLVVLYFAFRVLGSNLRVLVAQTIRFLLAIAMGVGFSLCSAAFLAIESASAVFP